ncbi:MAG: hypothetical protein LLG01_13320 [Planctomycetaceae bacterium]|nr:hypothetical protein [Planctomycetaceae bacterium]
MAPFAWAQGIGALFTSAVYDNDGQSNAVDREAAGNTKTLAQFKMDVAAAFQNNTGGVITFDKAEPGIDPDGSSGRSGNYPSGTMSVYFGAAANSSLDLSADSTVMKGARGQHVYSLLDIWQGNRLGPEPISGPLIKNNGKPGTCGAFLTSGTGLENDKIGKLNFSGCQIRQIGVTALSAAQQQVMTITVYFSGGHSQSQTETIAGGFGKDDVFFYFAAPPRQTIVSIRWESDVVSRPAIDDLAFLFSAPAECMFVTD